MSNAVQLAARLSLGPVDVVTDATLPSGLTSIQFGLRPSKKSALASSGSVRTISSPSSYVSLDGVGTGESVTQGNFIYLRTSVPMLLRLTTYSSGGDVTAILPIDGIFAMEFDRTRYLKLVELQGAGTVEWLITGDV